VTIRFMLLMPWGRVGSNLLLAILRQSAPMKLANENLNSLRTWEEQASWFRDFYETAAEAPAHAFIGSKQNLMAIRDVAAMTGLIRDAGLRVVRLRRDNVVRAAISQMRAELYAEQRFRETGERAWAVKAGAPPLGPASLDPDVLLTRIETMDRQHRQLMQAFPAEAVMDIEYEAINRDLDAVAVAVRDYLGVPQTKYRVPFDKATPDDLPSVVPNLEALRARLAATPYAEFL
jgi:hypothetical protein